MFLDLTTNYTYPTTNQRGNLVREKIIEGSSDNTLNLGDYSFTNSATYTKSVIEKPYRKPAPESLKKAMFKMSSKSIGKILSQSK